MTSDPGEFLGDGASDDRAFDDSPLAAAAEVNPAALTPLAPQGAVWDSAEAPAGAPAFDAALAAAVAPHDAAR